MFEKATAISAILTFLLFAYAGNKYLDFLENKNQVTKTSSIARQLVISNR